MWLMANGRDFMDYCMMTTLLRCPWVRGTLRGSTINVIFHDIKLEVHMVVNKDPYQTVGLL